MTLVQRMLAVQMHVFHSIIIIWVWYDQDHYVISSHVIITCHIHVVPSELKPLLRMQRWWCGLTYPVLPRGCWESFYGLFRKPSKNTVPGSWAVTVVESKAPNSPPSLRGCDKSWREKGKTQVNGSQNLSKLTVKYRSAVPGSLNGGLHFLMISSSAHIFPVLA